MFNRWISDTNTQWQIVDRKASPDLVSSAVTKSFFSEDPVRADAHYNGSGVKDGIDVGSTFRYIQNTKTNTDANYLYKACLETIIAASSGGKSGAFSVIPLSD